MAKQIHKIIWDVNVPLAEVTSQRPSKLASINFQSETIEFHAEVTLQEIQQIVSQWDDMNRIAAEQSLSNEEELPF